MGNAGRSASPRGVRYGRALRSARLAAGLRQTGVAAVVGVSQPTVARWEAGLTIPSDDHKAAVCRVLGVAPGVVFSLGEP